MWAFGGVGPTSGRGGTSATHPQVERCRGCPTALESAHLVPMDRLVPRPPTAAAPDVPAPAPTRRAPRRRASTDPPRRRAPHGEPLAVEGPRLVDAVPAAARDAGHVHEVHQSPWPSSP